jgi:hypothetical protein
MDNQLLNKYEFNQKSFAAMSTVSAAGITEAGAFIKSFAI